MRLRHLRDGAGTFGVESLHGGEVAGEELGGEDADDGRQPFGDRMRERDGRLGQGERGRVVRDDDQFGAVFIPQFGQHGFHRVVHFSRRRDGQDGESAFDHGDRSVLEIGGGIRLGDGVRQLFEFERPLEGGGVIKATSQHDALTQVTITLRHARDVRVERERLSRQSWDARQLVPARSGVVERGGDHRDGG